MNETKEQKARRMARKAKLDEAFQEYIRDMLKNGDIEPGILVAWVAGMQITHFGEDGEDRDGMIAEDKPGMNVFLARGVADATAERFQQTATGFYDPEDAA